MSKLLGILVIFMLLFGSCTCEFKIDHDVDLTVNIADGGIYDVMDFLDEDAGTDLR